MEEQEKQQEQREQSELNPHGMCFKIHQFFVMLFCCISYALVFFHRSAPAVVSKSIATDFNIDEADLSFFSSMFFWVYAVLQPFGGLLADVIDPAHLIGLSSILASVGSFICGVSKSVGVSTFGRFLVGFFCAPVYVPICKLITQWFPKNWYAVLAGIALGAGGAGGMIAQAPLKSFAEAYSWRWAFYGIAIIGIINGVCVLLIIRGDPTKFGYMPVNGMSGRNDITLKERFLLLWRNFLTVIAKPLYWFISVYAFFINGMYFNISSYWGGPYIRQVTTFNDGTMLLSLSIGMVVGSIILPIISNLVRTRKWTLEGNAVIATVTSAVFLFADNKLNYYGMYFLLILWGINTGAVTSISFTAIKENFEPSVAATCIGCVNIWVFLGCAVFQLLTGEILKKQEKVDGNYTHDAFRKALWIPTFIYGVISLLEPPFIPDNLPDKAKEEDNEDEESGEAKPVAEI